MPKEVTAEAGAFLVYDTIKLGKHGRESCRLKPPRYVVGTSSISSDHSECSTSPSLVTSPGSKPNSKPCNDPKGGTTHAEVPQVPVHAEHRALPLHPHPPEAAPALLKGGEGSRPFSTGVEYGS